MRQELQVLYPLTLVVLLAGIALGAWSVFGNDSSRESSVVSERQAISLILRMVDANSVNAPDQATAKASRMTLREAEDTMCDAGLSRAHRGGNCRTNKPDAAVWLAQVSGSLVHFSCIAPRTCDPTPSTLFQVFYEDGTLGTSALLSP